MTEQTEIGIDTLRTNLKNLLKHQIEEAEKMSSNGKILSASMGEGILKLTQAVATLESKSRNDGR